MKTIIPAELNPQLRSKAYSLAATVCALLATGALLEGDRFLALSGGTFAVILYCSARLASRRDQHTKPDILSHLLIAALIASTFFSILGTPGRAEQWSYILPLIVYLIYSLRTATLITVLYSIGFALSMVLVYRGPEKPQIFFIYLLSLVATLAFVYLREIKESQLQPLRRTDNLTLASTREYLLQDLAREIRRSEREGTSLSVLALSFDEPTLARSRPDDKDGLLYRLGRVLHEELRLFDMYYRYDNAEMVIILPSMTSREAALTAGRLRQTVRQKLSTRELTVTVSTGQSTLNVGDTAESLLGNARKTLEQARSRGGNQSRAFLGLDEELIDAG